MLLTIGQLYALCPCTGKWNLADMPENYVHSSAAFYANGVEGVFPVDNIMDINGD
jgi:hypothetical protein